MCQPWAAISKVTLLGIKANDEVKGNFSVRPQVNAAPGHRIGSLELFTDGRVVARFTPGSALDLDTTKLVDGYHELRVVAIDADPIETQCRQILPIYVNNRGGSVEFSVSPRSHVATTDKLRFSVRQPGATNIVIVQNGREIARFQGESGEAEVAAETLGRGPVVLQAQSEGDKPAVSAPLRLDIR